MPFGLCNAPPLFQQATNQDFQTIKQKYPNNFAHFMDDVCIGTGNMLEELVKHRLIVHELLDLFEKHSYFLKLFKCVFEAKEIEFLEFQVGYSVASIDQSKMDGLHNWPRTLTQLTKKGIPFKWTQECQDTLDQLIAKVTEDPKIIAPNPDK